MPGPESVAPSLPGVVVLAIRNVPPKARGRELQLFIVERMAKCDRTRAIKIAEKLPVLANAKIGGVDKKTGKPYATLVLSESDFDILTGKEPRSTPSTPPAANPPQNRAPANTPQNKVATGKPAANTSTTTYRKRRLPRPDLQQRWKDTLAREKLKTRLYGLEPLYAKLKKYHSWERNARLSGLSRKDDWGAVEYVQDKYRAAKSDLEAHLLKSGFASIEEFETVLRDYVDAFEKETLAISLDMLLKYEQALDKYEKAYQSQAGILALWGELSRNRARECYTKKESIEREIIRMSASDRGAFEQQRLQKLLAESKQYSRLAEAEMDNLAAKHPILKEQGFPRKRLATAEQADIPQLILKYLGDTQESIVDTWSALSKKITRIYKMDVLLKISYSEQEIAPGSIYDLAIQQRRGAVKSSELLKDIFLTVIAIAAGIFTGGTGTVAIVATGVTVGIGIYGAVDAINQYKAEAAAHQAQLLSEAPSAAWVVLALIGAGLDAKGAVSVFKEIRTSVQAFNATSNLADLAVLETKLAKHGKDLYRTVRKAAEQEVKYRQALKKLFSGASGGQLMVTIFPGASEIGKLVFVSYHLMKRGLISFEHFLLELKTQKLLKAVESYTPEQLTALKEAFEQTQNLAREITEHGQSLKLSPEQIESFITKWAEDGGKTLTLANLKNQMAKEAGEQLKQGKTVGKGAKGSPQPQPPKSPHVDVSSEQPRVALPDELRAPRPNTVYDVNGYIYKTDAEGAVAEVSGTLRLKKGVRNPKAQQTVGKSSGVAGDEGGHLIATRFDGSGEAINIVPQNFNLNRSLWKRMENEWAEALSAGRTVKLELRVMRSTEVGRPGSFHVMYTIEDGLTKTEKVRVFVNRAGG